MVSGGVVERAIKVRVAHSILGAEPVKSKGKVSCMSITGPEINVCKA